MIRDLLPLATDYIVKLQGDNEKIKAFVQKEWIPLEVLRMAYDSMTNSGEITAIEQLPEPEKERLRVIIRKWGTGDKANRMTQAKAIYLIEQLTEKKITA